MTAPAARPTILDCPQDLEDSSLPAWWNEQRAAGWEKFQSLPSPTHKSEGWRFTSLPKIKMDGFTADLPVSASDREYIIRESVTNRRERPCAGRIVFANGTLLHHSPLAPELAAKGVIWEPLRSALEKHEALVRRYFMQHESALGAEKFGALHRALCSNGSFLYVPKGVVIEEPLEAFYWITDDTAAVFPHTLLIAEPNSQVEVVDFSQSTNPQGAGFACAVSDLYVLPGAQARYVRSQNWGEKNVSFQLNHGIVERDSSLTTLHLNLGGAYSRTESKSRLAGSGATSDMLSLTLGSGTQEFDQRTYQDHAQPHCTSDLLYKNALSDDSRTIFSGMIDVKPGAQKTNAYQSNRNLLLSTTAEANSLPGLEIKADDVRCTHGATTGQVDQEQMFYLLARGLTPAKARELLVLGFFEEVLERLKDKDLSAELLGLISKKFTDKIGKA